MKLILQRVSSASVVIDNTEYSSIQYGLLILLGIEKNDTDDSLEYVVNKVLNLRIFKDHNNDMNLSIKDIKGEVLVVSQFTLCADLRKGRRPSFINAASPKYAEKKYNQFCSLLKKQNVYTKTGKFGASMDVKLINDGPVTIILDNTQLI